MYSLVLKPCRWVVFLAAVIPGTAPCSGLRPVALVTGAAGRRAAPRAACEVRRTAPADDFLARRRLPGGGVCGGRRGGAGGYFLGAPPPAGRALLGFLPLLPCHSLCVRKARPFSGF